MYNPFPLFSELLLKSKIVEGKRYFVRQLYPRGMSLHADIKAAFLIRSYMEEEKKLADEHMERIKHDRYAYLYDTQDSEQLQRLIKAAGQPDGYQVYYAGKQGQDWQPPKEYQYKMKQYVSRFHPGWKNSAGGQKVKAGIIEQYGQLLIKFSFEEEEDIVPLDNFEKM